MAHKITALLAWLLLMESAWAQATFLPPASNPIAAPPMVLGVWGTAAQCEAHRAGRTGDLRLLPYDINEQWLRQQGR